MGDGTEKNPYTRKDVLRLIEENGGTAEGLDLSGKVFEERIDLEKFYLKGIILKGAKLLWRSPNFEGAHLEGANLAGAHLDKVTLPYAHLEGAVLSKTHLEKAGLVSTHFEGADLSYARLEEAFLQDAHLEKANLFKANLERANLWGAHLERTSLSFACLDGANLWSVCLAGAKLQEAELSYDTKLERADWGNYILGEEREAEEEHGNRALFNAAANAYRNLKVWHTQHGLYDIAGKFYYREKEAGRKSLGWCSKLWYHRLALEFSRLVFGYGERWWNILFWMVGIIFGLAAAYFFWGSFSSSSFADTLYYSVASFTALGYGNWAPQPTGWAKGVGAAEAVLGVSMMALFLVTFVRKWTR